MYAVFFPPSHFILKLHFHYTSSFQSAVTFVMETFIVLGAPMVVFFDLENKKVLVKESRSRCFFLWLMACWTPALLAVWLCLLFNFFMMIQKRGWTCTFAAAKSLQLYPTLCDPIDCSLPGSTVPGIIQARKLEWVAISFSNA